MTFAQLNLLTDMDYRAWTDRAVKFLEDMRALPGKINVTLEIAPPLNASDLDSIQRRWERHLPAALIRFWTEGSACLKGQYVWTPPATELKALNEVFEYNNYIYGGPRFISASEVDPSPIDTSDFYGDIMSGDSESCQRTLDLWGRAIVLLHVGNGDCLGIDPGAPGGDRDDPPVVYLVHDDSSSDYIAASFTQFLLVWEQLSYIGPEFWLIHYWLDPATKSLSPERHHTQKLKDLLSPR